MFYPNVYADEKGFIDLGECLIGSLSGKTERYDLYAIEQPGGNVSFGAKYGYADHEYISGEAMLRRNGKYELYVHDKTALAAARYFANHNPNFQYD